MRFKTDWKVYSRQIQIIKAIYIFALRTIKMQVLIMMIMLITV